MKTIRIFLIGLLFFTNGYSQKNSFACALKLIALNSKITTYISNSGNATIGNAIETELSKMTTVNFAKALLTKNFWELNEPDLNIIFKNCDLIESNNNSNATFPILAKIFDYQALTSETSASDRNFNTNDTDNKIIKSLPSEAVIIQGITNFVAKRFKQEIELAFFKRFREFLKQNTTMGELYPKTVQIFKYDNFMGIDQLSTSLKEAFNSDLQNLPKNLVEAIQKPKIGSWFLNNRANPDLKDFFITGANYITNLEAGKNPQESFALLKNESSGKVKPFIEIIKIYQNELLFDGTWVTPSLFNGDINNVFTALLYSQHKSIFTTSLNEKDKNEYKNISLNFVNSLYDFSSAIYKYEIDKADTKDTKTFTIQDYEQYLSVYNKLISNASDFLLYKNVNALSTIKGFKNGSITDSIVGADVVGLSQELVQNFLEMKIAGKSSNYSLHVSNANFILTNLFDGKDLVIDETNNKGKMTLSKLLPKIFFYGTFITEFTNSKNEKDVENLLDKFALPAGGYSVKNKANYTFMLDAYVGANLGYENIVQNDNISSNKSYGSPFVALFAPIGLEITRRVNKNNIGFYLPIIDIAAPVSFRLGNTSDSLKTLPELSFKNIISPGLFIKYGLAKSPVSFLIGAKLAPLIRKKDGDVIFEANRGWRFGFSVAADLTLFKFWVSDKQRNE